MRRRRTAVLSLLLAALLALGGCNGLPLGDGSTGESPTPTPAPVPGDGPPSGLSRTGVTNPAALVDAHADRLSNRSYTRRVNETAVAPGGGTVARFRLTARVGADRRRIHVTIRSLRNGTTDPERRRYDLWVAGDRAVSRLRAGGETRYRVRDRAAVAGVLREWTAARVELAERYSPNAVRLDATPAGGADTYRLRATGTPAPTRLEVGPPPGNATATALVDGSGLIRRYEVRYRTDGTQSGAERVSVLDRVRFKRVGATTPERPSWVTNATATADQ